MDSILFPPFPLITALYPSVFVRGGAAYGVQVGAAGQNPWIQLLNESANEILYIQRVDLGISGSSFVFFEIIKGPVIAGSVRSVLPGPVAAEGALDPRVGKPAGQVWTVSALTPATATPQIVGGVEAFAGEHCWDAGEIAIIPPGFMFVLQGKNVATTLECAIRYTSVLQQFVRA